jgi:Zinc dependent phospholipase C
MHMFAKAQAVALLCIFLLVIPLELDAYSVLTHEAIIDNVWKDSIEKVLLKRFPHATPDDLRHARAYAYGGCIVQDMGYYPLGSHLFTDLTHYVRSADFIESLLRNARDINEYAFAIGALAHYVADNTGHPLAINRAAPMLYPKVKKKYGDYVTYGDDPSSHIKTEFAFDVLQVARGRYASKEYHDFIGFEVSKPVLERAFRETYGLELDDVFDALDASIASYRKSVSKTIPKATKVAWEIKKDEIVRNIPGATSESFVYNYRKPGLGTKFLAVVIRIVPKIGPLRALSFHAPTPETEKLFLQSFEEAVDRYRQLIASEQAGRLRIPDENFDLGQPSKAGEYKLADDTYAKLIEYLAKDDFASVSPALRTDILTFYKDRNAPIATKRNTKQWEKVVEALDSNLR